MAHHRYGRSPAKKSTPCHQAPCHHSAARPSAPHYQHTPLRTDFIPSWLQHVPTGYDDASREIPREASPGNAPETSWHPNGIPNVRIKSTYDAARYQSSDLFIQDSPSPVPSAVQTGRHHQHESDLRSDYDGVSVDRGRGSNSRILLSTPPPASVINDNAFQKRPRRKTRQDRYDTIKSKDAIPTKKQAKRPSTRVSKSGRLRSSREVMANFKSRAITNPNERITLKSTFTPGLFVNGRSSAPVADLVFNEIPVPDEDGEPSERKRSSDSSSKRTKDERARREDIEYLTNALKRLKEDYPVPDLLGSRSLSILSGGDFPSIRRSSTADIIDDVASAKEAGLMPAYGLNGGIAPDKAGDGDTVRSLPEGHEMQSHSAGSRATANEAHFFDSIAPRTPTRLNGDSRLKDQKTAPGRQSELEPRVSRGELKSCGSQTVDILDYQDKGVMVSPWMCQSTEMRKPNDSDDGNQPLCLDEGKVPIVAAEPHWPHAVPQIPVLGADQQAVTPEFNIPGIDVPHAKSNMYGYPTYLPGISARLDFGADVEDAQYHHTDPSPTWLFGRPSSQFPLLTVGSYSNSSSTRVDDPGVSTTSNMQSTTHHPGIPSQPTTSGRVFPIAQGPRQELDFLCTNALQDDEDVPGETLAEYIERMEREILGPDETSSFGTDGGLLPTQPKGHNQMPDVPHTVNTQYTDNSPHRVEPGGLLTPKGSTQRPVREYGWRPQQSQSLPIPESLDDLDHSIGSELAFFWRPNHMMWC
ncbi:hypothetical protein V8C26DRAFT_26079 [Trichoderma gracile]